MSGRGTYDDETEAGGEVAAVVAALGRVIDGFEVEDDGGADGPDVRVDWTGQRGGLPLWGVVGEQVGSATLGLAIYAPLPGAASVLLYMDETPHVGAFETGDAVFDREVGLEAAPRDLAMHLLDDAMRARLVAFRAAGGTGVRVDAEVIGVLVGHGLGRDAFDADELVQAALAVLDELARRLPGLEAAHDAAAAAHGSPYRGGDPALIGERLRQREAERRALLRRWRRRGRLEQVGAVMMVAALVGLAAVFVYSCVT